MSLARALVAIAAITFPSLVAAQTYPMRDARSNLKHGRLDAGEAALNMRLVSFTPKAALFDSTRGLTFVNSDLAFKDKYVVQGNFAGFTIWDVSDAAKPRLVSTLSCITSQGDPTIVGNLLFVSAEGDGNRSDCAKGGVENLRDGMAGVRIFDISDPAKPRFVKNVQTCKGSHTHTLVPHPKDKNTVYLYVSGSRPARPDSIIPGCKNGDDPADETNSMFRLDVIKVPLRNPERAEVVTGARIFTGLDPAPRATGRPSRGGGRRGGDTTQPPPRPTGPRNCHDVTAYPAVGLLAGACGSYGLLVDISNPEKPVRLDAKADTNFSLWHTAIFSNDGKKVVFTDEWGGGTSPMCQANSMMEMGGNTILTIDSRKKYTQHAYFKIPTAQTAEENCVSHNGGLIPVPGRDIMVQGWYQGGVSVMEFTDPDHPRELAYFDRGPIDPPRDVDAPTGVGTGNQPRRGTIGGSWGAYWWNGYLFSSEMDRGFDIFELLPSEHLSANEIAAAKLVKWNEYNPQSQPKIEWPAAFPVVRSYLDQLVRGNGLARERTSAIASALDAAEQQSGKDRRNALTALASQVDKDVAGARDGARVKAMSDAIKALAKATK